MMPRWTLLLIVALVLTIGCSTEFSDRSDIPDSLLVGVIVDIYSATARAHLDGTDPKVARVEALAQRGLDTTMLNRTFDRLAEDPDSASALLQRALDSLIVIQRDLRAGPELDSLQKHVRG